MPAAWSRRGTSGRPSACPCCSRRRSAARLRRGIGFCGCAVRRRTTQAVDLRTLDRHPWSALTSLIPASSRRNCRPRAPFAELVCLSDRSIADETREEHTRRILGDRCPGPAAQGGRREATLLIPFVGNLRASLETVTSERAYSVKQANSRMTPVAGALVPHRQTELYPRLRGTSRGARSAHIG
jgi:hypothetical protein